METSWLARVAVWIFRYIVVRIRDRFTTKSNKSLPAVIIEGKESVESFEQSRIQVRSRLLTDQRKMTKPNRRKWMHTSLAAAALGSMRLSPSHATEGNANSGQVVGDSEAALVGGHVLSDGGNAVDAIVAGAFAAAVTAVGHTGIGGYGGAATIAIEGGRRVISIDFNSTAPSAMTEDRFQLNKLGGIVDRANEFGCLAAGVPGVLAGLALTLKTGGSWSLRDTLQPAIALTRNGFVVAASLATAIQHAFGGHAFHRLGGGTALVLARSIAIAWRSEPSRRTNRKTSI